MGCNSNKVMGTSVCSLNMAASGRGPSGIKSGEVILDYLDFPCYDVPQNIIKSWITKRNQIVLAFKIICSDKLV